jgi:hypothetical protein
MKRPASGARLEGLKARAGTALKRPTGETPRNVTVTQMSDLPPNWQEQRQTLGLI